MDVVLASAVDDEMWTGNMKSWLEGWGSYPLVQVASPPLSLGNHVACFELPLIVKFWCLLVFAFHTLSAILQDTDVFTQVWGRNNRALQWLVVASDT